MECDISYPRVQKIGLGRDWNRPTLKKREAYVTNSVIRQIGVDIGEEVQIGLNFEQLAMAFGYRLVFSPLIHVMLFCERISFCVPF